MDNFYHNCPPKMDGRHLGNYQTATRRNEYIKFVNDVYRDDQYRLFLQKNGTELLDNMWNYQKGYNSCPVTECIHHYPLRTNPRQFVQEREAYDSIHDMDTNASLAHMRTCIPVADYRLNPSDPPIPDVPVTGAFEPADQILPKLVPDRLCRSCNGGYRRTPKPMSGL